MSEYTPPLQDLIEAYVRLGRNDESRMRRDAAVRALDAYEAGLRAQIAAKALRDFAATGARTQAEWERATQAADDLEAGQS